MHFQLVDLAEVLVKTPLESVISVKGVVATRPADQVNPVSIYLNLFHNNINNFTCVLVEIMFNV